MSDSITNEEFLETVTKKELLCMLQVETDMRMKCQHINHMLNNKVTTAEKEADKYRRFWRDEISKNRTSGDE